MKTPIGLQVVVSGYQKGNKEAFNHIYEQSYKYLHTCVIHVVKDEDTAMDMLQETYLEISKSISQLKNPEDFLSWAAMIANRKCFAYLKKQKNIVLVDENSLGGDAEDNKGDYFENIADDEELIPETVLQDREKQRLIKEIIDGLNDMQRLCVIGFYYNEQKQEEIAEELGIPVNTVKSHLNRAKAKIKEAVVELDVKKGTRLYSFAPFMALLFKEEVQACVIKPMSEAVAAAVGLSGAGGAAGAAAGGNLGLAAKLKAAWSAAGAAVKAKVAIGAAVGVVAVGGVIAVSSLEDKGNEIKSADLDIIITEEGISSELFDVDYDNISDADYIFRFDIVHDSECPTITIHGPLSHYGTNLKEKYRVGNVVINTWEPNGRPVDTRELYIKCDAENYVNVVYNGCTEETFQQFVGCMFEADTNVDSNELFKVEKDKIILYEWGIGIDLNKVREALGEVYYSYMILGQNEKITHLISNRDQHGDIEEIHTDFLRYSKVIEDRYFVNVGDYEWRGYVNVDGSATWEINQLATMDGTTWQVWFDVPEDMNMYDYYANYMKGLN